METTWDGLPVAGKPPYACCVVVWRRRVRGPEFLVLHRRAAAGADYDGDWAWTPPSGARLPGEEPDEAAVRELREETGLVLPIAALREAAPSADVALYVAEAPPDADVVLDEEHDRYRWLPLDEAVRMCLPPEVGASLANAAARLERRVIDA
jgi:8-oxo-dGTP pyrophosphatase MutT (NUDIX family)